MKEPTAPFLVFKKSYEGFESAVDIYRDVAEMLDRDFNPAVKELPGEFQGTLQLHITYQPYISIKQQVVELIETSMLPGFDKKHFKRWIKDFPED